MDKSNLYFGNSLNKDLTRYKITEQEIKQLYEYIRDSQDTYYVPDEYYNKMLTIFNKLIFEFNNLKNNKKQFENLKDALEHYNNLD